MFKKLTVLDNVVLFEEHFRRLAACARSLQLDLGLTSEEMSERLAVLEATGADVECITECRSARLTDDQLITRLRGTDCLVTCWQPLSAKVLEALAPELRVVLYWTDVTRADLQAARRLNVHVDNVAEYGVNAVPEYVFAALLELLRRPAYHHLRAKTGSFDYENLKTARKGIIRRSEVQEESLAGKHLGIVGLGRIGARVAAIAKNGFGMNVCHASRRSAEGDRLGIARRSIEEVFDTCDIVSLHLPPTIPSVLVDSGLLERLRPDSIFINTGSAKAVDYDALLRLLEEKRFRAVLDVFPGLPPRHRLKALDNVFFSYRAAWLTRQSLQVKGDILLDKLEAWLASHPRTGRTSCVARTGRRP